MSNAFFGWENHILSGLLTASSESPALPAGNLALPSGNAAEGWQTLDGVTTATLTHDALAPVSTRALGLFRSNFTPDAVLRWRMAAWAELLADPQALATDTNAGATRWPNLTRVGSITLDDGSPGTVYESSATVNSSATVQVALKPGRYRVQVKAQRISGSGTTGRLIGARYYQAGQLRAINVPMTALAPSGVATYTAEIVNDQEATVSMVFLGETGPMGQVAIGSGLLTPLADHDSGPLPGPATGFGQVLHLTSQPVSARYLRCDISDPTNPDAYLRAALAWRGDGWQPGINLSAGATALSPTRQREVRESRGGSQRVRPRYFRRGWSIGHEGLVEADTWQQLAPLERAAHSGRNILFLPNPDSPWLAQEAVFGLLTVTGDVSYPYQTTERRAWRARIDERL